MNYDGGKNGEGVWQTIINQMPPHDHYVELFLGSGAVMRRKRPAPENNIGVEIDPVTVAAVKPQLASAAVEVQWRDAMDWLGDFKTAFRWRFEDGETLIYADPPYLLETRSCQRDLYSHEFHTREQHAALLALLNEVSAMVILSGYPSSFYDERLPAPKWRKLEFTAGSRGGPRTEVLWMNFPAGEELHDYRFLGKDKTDRQRIRRKISRWQSRLAALPGQERNAIIEGLDRGGS